MTVFFIGAGPGDPELITVKGQRLVRSCPVILYAGSLVPAAVLSGHAAERVVNTAELDLDQIIALLKAAHDKGQDVARVHSGDPSLYGAICSPIAPYSDGSPECTRATSWPLSCAALSSAIIWSRSSSAVLTTRSAACPLNTAAGTSEPAYRITGQLRTRRCPFTVISSGSPGPAPIKNTVIQYSNDSFGRDAGLTRFDRKFNLSPQRCQQIVYTFEF